MAQGEEFIVTHSIARLCDEYDKGFLALKKEIKALTPYYVWRPNIPNALEEIPALYFDEEDVKRAIKMARKALDFVKRAMNP